MFAWRPGPRKRRRRPPRPPTGTPDATARGALHSGGRMFSKPPRPLPLVAGVILAMLVGVTSAAAQSSTLSSGIEGRVTDETGGALPGVSVTIKQSRRCRSRSSKTVSDEAGRYRFARLPGGTYVVNFQLAGFKTRDAGRAATRRQLRRHHRRETRHRPARRDRHRHRRLAGRGRAQHDRRLQHQGRDHRAAADLAQLRGHRQAGARHPRRRAFPTSAATRPAAAAARWSTTARATAARR